MSISEAESLCTSRTRAIILMHFAGYVANSQPWQDLARRKGLYLIADAAHAPGVSEAARFGDAAAFSFYGNKNMTTAEGGAIIARDPALLQKMRQARSHGMTSSTHQRLNSRTPNYDVTMLGFNYRLDDLRRQLVVFNLRICWNGMRLAHVSRTLQTSYSRTLP